MLNKVLLCAVTILPMFAGANEQDPANGQASFKVEDPKFVCLEKEEGGETLARCEDDEPKQIFYFDNADEKEGDKIASADDESDESKLFAADEDQEPNHLACDDSEEEGKSVV